MSTNRTLLQNLQCADLAPASVAALTRGFDDLKESAEQAAKAQIAKQKTSEEKKDVSMQEHIVRIAEPLLYRQLIQQLFDINLPELYKLIAITLRFGDRAANLTMLSSVAEFTCVCREWLLLQNPFESRDGLMRQIYDMLNLDSRPDEFNEFKAPIATALRDFSKLDFLEQVTLLQTIDKDVHTTHEHQKKLYTEYAAELETKLKKAIGKTAKAGELKKDDYVADIFSKLLAEDKTVPDAILLNEKIIGIYAKYTKACLLKNCFTTKDADLHQKVMELQRFSHLLPRCKSVLVDHRTSLIQNRSANTASFALLSIPALVRAVQSKRKHGSARFWRPAGENVVATSESELSSLKKFLL